MLRCRFHAAALSIAAGPLIAGGHPARAMALDQVSDQAGPTQTVIVTAQHLNEERSHIETQTGASTYTINQAALQAMPAAENNPLNQFLLQAPDVAQDSFGQVHIRGDHNGLQYRLNGIILPEGIAVFGQTLDPRLIESMKLIMGSLPAEYGLRTAGIVDLTTKSGGLEPGGYVSLYGGSHGEIEPSANYGGTSGSLTYFVSGTFLRDDLGIESPDGSANPLHDHTTQNHEFAYLEDILDDADRVSFIAGSSDDRFQIPDLAGGQPAGVSGVMGLGPCGSGASFYAPPCSGADMRVLTVDGQYAYPSSALDENQREITRYAIASFQRSSGPLSIQSSFTARYSSLDFTPDPIGDLLYNGISQYAYKRDVAYAWQTDTAYRLGDAHTVRAGLYIERDELSSRTTSLVLPVDPASGAQASDVPLPVLDDYGKTQWIYSIYLQDEWRILPRLVVNYGLRCDKFTSFDSESAASPRINFVWQATDRTTVHAGYSRYFSPPPFELVGGETIAKFLSTTAQPAILEDDPVRAERDDYYDLGIEQSVTAALTLGLDSYYKQATNLLDEGQFGAPIILTPFNYGHGEVHGVELTGAYARGPVSAYWNLASQRAIGKEIVSSQFNFGPDELVWIANHYIHLDHEQQVSASAGASYLWLGTRFSIDMILGSGLRSNLVLPSGQSIPNGDHLPYYTQFNLGVMHDFTREGLKGLTARLDVINVADKIYEIRNGTGVGVGAPQFGPRRGIFGGVAMAF